MKLDRQTRLVLLIVLLCLVGARPSFAQTTNPYTGRVPPPSDDDPRLLEELRRVQQSTLKSTYAYDQLSYLCNGIGPRMSGSPQEARAVEYVADEMRRLGLSVRLEKVKVPHWVRGAEAGELIEWPGGIKGATHRIVLAVLGRSVATPPEGLTAEVVVVNDFDELRGLGRAGVAGKIVLFNRRFDERMAAAGYVEEAYNEVVMYRGLGAGEAERFGAVASLVRSIGPAGNGLPHTGGMKPAGIPAAAVNAESADLIASLAARGRVRMHLTLTPRALPDAMTYNVLGDLKGSEHPEQVVIVSGHLDSWDLGTGALDDGAGLVMALQTAQVLRQLNLRPKRTIRVIAWAAEEIGLLGARAYARDHAAELGDHVAAIESDTGAGHALGFLAHVAPQALPLLKPATKVLESSGANLIKTEGEPAPDLIPLRDAGVPSFLLLLDERDFYYHHHTAADTLDKVRPGDLAEDSAAVAVLAYALANTAQPLPR